jgi:hypothetical protein
MYNTRYSLYQQGELFWPNTVHLTLSIQYSFELIVILQRGAISYLEHLNVTIEQDMLQRWFYWKPPPRYIRLCGYNIRQRTDATRLRTLILRHLPLYELVLLLGFLNMPLLEKLILIDIFDESKLFNLFML